MNPVTLLRRIRIPSPTATLFLQESCRRGTFQTLSARSDFVRSDISCKLRRSLQYSCRSRQTLKASGTVLKRQSPKVAREFARKYLDCTESIKFDSSVLDQPVVHTSAFNMQKFLIKPLRAPPIDSTSPPHFRALDTARNIFPCISLFCVRYTISPHDFSITKQSV